MADFDFSTIIYLIIMVVFAILGGKRKKKRGPQPQGQGNSQNANPLDLLSSLFDNQPKPAHEIQYENYDDTSFVESETEMHHETESRDFHKMNKKEKEIDLGSAQEKKNPSVNLGQQIGAEESVINLEEFDVRKAVIYSEILNRKIY